MTRLLYKESLWILVIGIVGISGLMKEYMDHSIKSYAKTNDATPVSEKRPLDYSMLPVHTPDRQAPPDNETSGDSTHTTIFKSGM